MSRGTERSRAWIGCDVVGCTARFTVEVPQGYQVNFAGLAKAAQANGWTLRSGGCHARCVKHRAGGPTSLPVARVGAKGMPEECSAILVASVQELLSAAQVAARLPERVILVGHSQQVSPMLNDPILEGNPRVTYVLRAALMCDLVGPAVAPSITEQLAARQTGFHVVVIVGREHVWCTTVQLGLDVLPQTTAPGGRA